MLKLYCLVFVLFLLVGCHNVKPDPIIQYVDRPIYCAELPEETQYMTSELSKDDTIYRKVEALLIEIEQRKIAESELRAIVVGCSK